jgi:hypothetical protein
MTSKLALVVSVLVLVILIWAGIHADLPLVGICIVSQLVILERSSLWTN